MKYKLVIFDFDGTLADTFSWLMKVINEVADQYQFRKITNTSYQIIRNYDAHQILEYLKIPLEKMPQIQNHLRTLIAENIHQISLFKGIDHLFRQLSGSGVKLAIVTSNTYENVSRILGLENAMLINYYDCNISLFNKPDSLQTVLSKSGIPYHETIYIGDEIRDIEAAQKINIAFGAVSWGYNTINFFKAYSPNDIYADVTEMLDKLLL